MNTIISPQIFKNTQLYFQNNLKNPVTFKGELKADTFEKRPALKRGQVLDDKGLIYTLDLTDMFREDLDWIGFGNFLEQRFAKCNKVNTYVYGCSDGSEAYSLSILLQNKFKGDAKKFFPIFAKDIDEEKISQNIIKQKDGNIGVPLGYYEMRSRLNLEEEEAKKYISFQ